MNNSDAATRVKNAVLMISVIVLLHLFFGGFLFSQGSFKLNVPTILFVIFRDLIMQVLLAFLITVAILKASAPHSWSPLNLKQAILVGLSRALLMLLVWNAARAFGRGFAKGWFAQ